MFLQIAQIVDDLRAAVFILDPSEEEAGKVVLELLQPSATESDSIENAEKKAIQLAALRLRITSSKDMLVERRSIKKLLDKVSDSDPKKKKILKYLCYLLMKHGNLILEEQTENASDQQEGPSALNNHSDNSLYDQSVEAGADVERGQYETQTDMLSRAIPPEEFKCPLSSRLMYDPVVIASGQTFERMWIQKWFDEGNDTCPKTKIKLAHQSFTPNAAMRDLISKWCKQCEITIPDPNVRSVADHSLETSSTSIASFAGYMNDLHIPADISNISLGSLDISSTSDYSHAKIVNGLCLKSEQMSYDLCRYQSSTSVTETVLESLSKLDELHWEEQCKVVGDMKDHLEHNNHVFQSSESSLESLLKFLRSANHSHDTRAQRAGFELLLVLISKNRDGIHYLGQEAFTLLSSFLDSEVIGEALHVMELLSETPNCRSKIVASSALPYLVKILDSHVRDFQERAIKILCNLSSINNVCSDLVSLNCIPRLVAFLCDETLARHCMVIFKNLLNNQEGRASITSTTGCIASIAELLETGNREVQEAAVTVLLSLCLQSVRHCQLVMEEGVIPALVYISKNGTEKGRAGALELLRILRDISHDNEQGSYGADLVTSEDASNSSKENKSSSKTSRFLGFFASKKKK
ncbi:hypothetical protein SLEP1_g7991 [Rubroshorea leprosula]|uniref:RING-type E3 ubiquitin transferase n=3 Tax=Rubroshorea leprosula TaxID=152421 RepID=A0AAV5IB55_9ROSI|nr:hypothetical protein SLEP1_g7991 [Rubroshorea leprosula]